MRRMTDGGTIRRRRRRRKLVFKKKKKQKNPRTSRTSRRNAHRRFPSAAFRETGRRVAPPKTSVISRNILIKYLRAERLPNINALIFLSRTFSQSTLRGKTVQQQRCKYVYIYIIHVHQASTLGAPPVAARALLIAANAIREHLIKFKRSLLPNKLLSTLNNKSRRFGKLD